MEIGPLIGAGVALAALAAPPLARWAAVRRLRARLASWADIAERNGWENVPDRLRREHALGPLWLLSGLSLAWHWKGELEGHELRVVAYRRLFGRFLYQWWPWVFVQVRLDPGSARIYPASKTAVLWQVTEHTIWSTNWKRMHSSVPEDHDEPVDGIRELRAAGLSNALPQPVREALRRACDRGTAWVIEDRLVFAWRLNESSEPRGTLTEALRDARTVVQWIEG